MGELTQTEIKEGYFAGVGGFAEKKSARLVTDYDGEDCLSIWCTQLDYEGYSKKEQKYILADWIRFLQANPKMFRKLHFNSHVPQALFDAACCQENLEELRFKWGNYSDLSALKGLKNLKFLYIGSGARVQNIEVLKELRNLVVLHIENFKHVEDYSLLTKLDKLEQLVISGPILGRTPVKDLEFLYDMKSLVSVWLPNTTIQRKYTTIELSRLREDLSNIYFI